MPARVRAPATWGRGPGSPAKFGLTQTSQRPRPAQLAMPSPFSSPRRCTRTHGTAHLCQSCNNEPEAPPRTPATGDANRSSSSPMSVEPTRPVSGPPPVLIPGRVLGNEPAGGYRRAARGAIRGGAGRQWPPGSDSGPPGSVVLGSTRLCPELAGPRCPEGKTAQNKTGSPRGAVDGRLRRSTR